ncbi:MAG: hydroxyacylglutathione hydrolase [Ramlibacter sp.]
MTLIPVPAFQDNYLWVLHDGQRALVVDPGDAQPVSDLLRRDGLQLDTILVTHHHADHVGGVDRLRNETGARVIGTGRERIPGPLQKVVGGDEVEVLGIRFRVIDVPGHTAGHIAFFAEDVDGRPLLFCGDTLFSGGCGRLFEGTPAQMLASLDALSALPASTRVCCAHEYTLSNLRFARAVDPTNQALLQYQHQCESLRQRGQPTLPAVLGEELRINPFLRARQPEVARAAQAFNGADPGDAVAVFAAIRQWKNDFR